MFKSLMALLCASATAVAQTPCTTGQRAPDLGYGFLTCHDCLSTMMSDGVRIMRFTGQPAVFRVRADGPAAGRLADGDTIVSVNGQAITSDAAAIALARWKPGQMIIGIRHNGALSTVSITPTSVCIGSAASVTTRDLSDAQVKRIEVIRADLNQSLRRLDSIPVRLRADSVNRIQLRNLIRISSDSLQQLSRDLQRLGKELRVDSIQWRADRGALAPLWIRADSLRRPFFSFDSTNFLVADSLFLSGAGWKTLPMLRNFTASEFFRNDLALGITVSCTSCTLKSTSGKQGWAFDSFPVVASVEAGSFAERLGLQRGDTITAVDGQSVLTSGAGAKLAAPAPGSTLKLTWQREGKTMSASALVAPPAELRGSSNRFNAIGKVGNASVEVRGLHTSWTRDPVTGALTIRGDSMTVVLMPPPGGRDTLKTPLHRPF